MFPINFNFPYRKKDGSLITMEKALDGAGADLDLIDLDDVAITDPAEGDGLIYDNTAHKWKNIPIISRIVALFDAWRKNGAYNLACGVFTSKIESGSTWVANSDGSVSVSGESAGSNITSSAFTLKAGTYLVGYNPIPQSGEVTTDATNLTILDSSNNHLPGLPLNDATSKVITVAADTVVKIRLYAYANSSGHTTNTTFYPVITTDLNATVADFVPPAKTNSELTEDVKVLSPKFKDLGEIEASQIDSIPSIFFPEVTDGGRVYYSCGYTISGTGVARIDGYEYSTGIYGFQVRMLFNGTLMKRYKNNSSTWSAWENV